jgi:hypothetical protein
MCSRLTLATVAAASAAAASAAAASAAAAASPAPALLRKLGLYDYMTQETTPLVFNGRNVLMESMIKGDPQWAGHWIPAFQNCDSYVRVRDLASGVVLANVSQSCDHAFASALVATGEGGLESLYIFATAWVRDLAPAPPAAAAAAAGGAPRDRGVGWSGPCSAPVGNCTIAAFVSSDPALGAWRAVPRLAAPGPNVTYNVDVTHVGVAGPARAARLAAAGLPDHEWVMQTEGPKGPQFWVSAAVDPADPAGWTLLDPATYNVDRFGNNEIGGCPSLRHDAVTGWYYSLTGGKAIIVVRSKNLTVGSWQLASAAAAGVTAGGVVLPPTADDCALAPAPYGGWFVPDANASAHLAACKADGWGNDSDVDLTEVLLPGGGVGTLVQYGSGDQHTVRGGGDGGGDGRDGRGW